MRGCARHLKTRFLLLLCGLLWLAGAQAIEPPVYILLSASENAPGYAALPQQLSKWRQLGLVSDAQLLNSQPGQPGGFDALGILEFPNEPALQNWQETARQNIGEGVTVTVADALTHGEKTPRNSADSIFVIMQYDVMVPRAQFQDYVDHYQKTEMEERIAARTINRYTDFFARPGSNAPWKSLLVQEYRDPHSWAISGDVNKAISKRLRETNQKFREFSKTKLNIRNKTATTEALWVELPPPDLGELPAYKPETRLTGSLRIVGSELKNAVELLAKGFTFFHPDVKVSTNDIPSSEGGIAGLYTGISDVAPMGDDAKITDLMPYHNTFGYLPTEISVATGGYEKRGSLFAWAVVVNKDNPLDHISVEQLKRVFEGERTGGWEINHNDYKFTSRYAVPREALIRTWDQLGLGGDYKGREIETFGYAAPGFAIAIERSWFHWSKKWNANFREYVEAKQTTPDSEGAAVASERPLEDLQTNPYAIGIVALLHAKHYPNVKLLKISRTDDSEPVALTPENVATRRYPLIRDAYFYVSKPPGGAVDPIVREFMRYCLSREGQEAIVKAGYYYPLPKDYLLEQRRKLD